VTSAAIVYASLLLARIAAFVAVMPLFGARTPLMVRVSFTIVLTAFYLGAVAPGWDPEMIGRPVEIDVVRYGLSVARESIIGAAMGFMFGLFLLPARVAGEFITIQVGLNVAPQSGAADADTAGPLTNVFEIVAGLLFLIADGHHVVLATLHASFSKLPIGDDQMPRIAPAVDGLTSAYEMGLLLAGPLALCLFLLAITLAFMARTAPQLNIYSVGFTLQVFIVLFGGLFLLPEFVLTLHAIIGRTGTVLPLMMGG
jgi:flagellar biosynthetic protein FliR